MNNKPITSFQVFESITKAQKAEIATTGATVAGVSLIEELGLFLGVALGNRFFKDNKSWKKYKDFLAGEGTWKSVLVMAIVLAAVSAGVVVAARAIKTANDNHKKAMKYGDTEEIQKAKKKVQEAEEKLDEEKAKAREKWSKMTPEEKAIVKKKAIEKAKSFKL